MYLCHFVHTCVCVFADGMEIVKVSCGAQHTVALTGDGEVWCWGAGQKLGINCTDCIKVPKKVEFLVGRDVLDVATGAHHTLAIVRKLSRFNPHERRKSHSKSAAAAAAVAMRSKTAASDGRPRSCVSEPLDAASHCPLGLEVSVSVSSSVHSLAPLSHADSGEVEAAETKHGERDGRHVDQVDCEHAAAVTDEAAAGEKDKALETTATLNHTDDIALETTDIKLLVYDNVSNRTSQAANVTTGSSISGDATAITSAHTSGVQATSASTSLEISGDLALSSAAADVTQPASKPKAVGAILNVDTNEAREFLDRQLSGDDVTPTASSTESMKSTSHDSPPGGPLVNRVLQVCVASLWPYW